MHDWNKKRDLLCNSLLVAKIERDEPEVAMKPTGSCTRDSEALL